MERAPEEIVEYLTGLRTQVNEAIKKEPNMTPLEKTLSGSLVLMANYMEDFVDSMQATLSNVNMEWTTKYQDLEEENKRLSERSVQMIMEMKKFKDATGKVEELDKSVDKLTDTILRNLKDISVNGADNLDEEEPKKYKIKIPYSEETEVYHDDNAFWLNVPKGFDGRVHVNGQEWEEGINYRVIEDDEEKKYGIGFYEPIMQGDRIKVYGLVDKESDVPIAPYDRTVHILRDHFDYKVVVPLSFEGKVFVDGMDVTDSDIVVSKNDLMTKQITIIGRVHKGQSIRLKGSVKEG